MLKKILEEQEDFLFEQWSHYADIDFATEYIYQRVADTVYKAKDVTVVEGKSYCRRGVTEINVFGKDLKLYFLMYIATDNEFVNYMINYCYSHNGIDKNENIIYITLYTVNGELLEPMCNKTVAHELKHVLQMAKSEKNDINYDGLGDLAFEHSAEVLDNTPNYSAADVYVAWLYYYSNPHEQDAFMEEYYKDLCYAKEFIEDEKSETHTRFKEYENLIQWYQENKDDNEVVSAVNQYRVHGMPKRNFETMITNGYKRFKRKMNNIEKHFKESSQYLKEHHYHGGLKTRTGSTISFKFSK